MVPKFDPAERSRRKLGLEFAGCIGLDPCLGLGAEGGLLRRVVEVHGRALVLGTCPGRRAARSGALQSRGPYLVGNIVGPGSAEQRVSRCTASGTRNYLPLVGILLNGTSLSTRISPGRPSTRSAMMLRMISSVPPSMRVPGARNSIAWNLPATSASSGPLSMPAAPCKSSAQAAT